MINTAPDNSSADCFVGCSTSVFLVSLMRDLLTVAGSSSAHSVHRCLPTIEIASRVSVIASYETRNYQERKEYKSGVGLFFYQYEVIGIPSAIHEQAICQSTYCGSNW